MSVPAVPALSLGAFPSPEPGVVTPDPSLITPGTIGFLVTFFVAVAVVLLARDMNRRVRRIRVRAEREDAAQGGATTREDGRRAEPPGPRTPTDGDGDDGSGSGIIREH